MASPVWQVRCPAVGSSAGIICSKTGFGCTTVDGDSVEDHDIQVPGNLKDRGEQLCWLAEEAERLITASGCTAVAVQRAAGGGPFGASAERHEVEAAVQMGVHRGGLGSKRMTKESVRSALGVAKGRNAYDTLLQRPDVKARSNQARRHQYLLALAAQA